MINFLLKASHLLTDATYKTNDEGFPSLTCGETDKTKKLHPFGIGVCFHEKTEDFSFMFKDIRACSRIVNGKDFDATVLVADSSESIAKGFIEAFTKL
jgi:hypothetical protein